jgi:hypothetical protein
MEFHLTEAEREASYKRMEAQARLVACAPDLLAALKWCVEWDGECLADNPRKLSAFKAIIARAEGQS